MCTNHSTVFNNVAVTLQEEDLVMIGHANKVWQFVRYYATEVHFFPQLRRGVSGGGGGLQGAPGGRPEGASAWTDHK